MKNDCEDMEADERGESFTFEEDKDTIKSKLVQGRALLRSITSPEGMISSLTVIREHINKLNTDNASQFAHHLGAILEFVNLNYFRSSIMLGQNPTFFNCLYKFVDKVDLQTYIMKIVGLVAITVKFSAPVEEAIRTLFLSVALEFVQRVTSSKRLFKKRTLPKLDLELASREQTKEDDEGNQVEFIEEIDEEGARVLYSLLVIEKNKEHIRTESAIEFAISGLTSLEFIGSAFRKLKRGDLLSALNESINNLLKWMAPLIPAQTAVLRLPEFIMVSLVFQQKTDFVYSLQTYLEELIVTNKGKAAVVLMDLLCDEVEFKKKILVGCTKLRSILFVSRILKAADPELANNFFDRGGREKYMGLLRKCLVKDKFPKIYIFLEDETLLTKMTCDEEMIITAIMNKIINGVVRYQFVERIANFNKALHSIKASKQRVTPEFTTISKVFRAKETAEVVMKGIVSNIWKENSFQSNNLVIEVKNKRRRKSIEIDLTSPGNGSAKSNRSAVKSTKSGKTFRFNERVEEDSIEAESFVYTPNKVTRDAEKSFTTPEKPNKVDNFKKKGTLYTYDFHRELTTKDTADLMESFFQYNSTTKRIELYRDKEIRLVYHRKVQSANGLFFALLEINNTVDLILLNAIVYSPHMRKIFLSTNIRKIERMNQEGRPYYERDFVTLCTTSSEITGNDHLIVMLDKQDGVNRLLYKPLLKRSDFSEFSDFENIFRSHGTLFNSMRSFTLSSGLNSVLVGCKHLLAVFNVRNNILEFKSMISDTGFTLSRIRLLDRATSTYMILGYVSRQFNIVNLSNKKIYNFVFEWLETNQTISEVEIDENIMVYLIEDSKRKHSSIYIRDNEQMGSHQSLEYD